MERALVSGELNSEQELLNRSEQLSESLKDQIIDLEEKYMKQREIVCDNLYFFTVSSYTFIDIDMYDYCFSMECAHVFKFNVVVFFLGTAQWIAGERKRKIG